MEKFITKDGSATFYNEKYDDIYHSVSGAVEEAVEKFVKPTNIAKLAMDGSIRLLDICFGLGYNAGAAIDAVIESNKDCMIEIICLESDRHILRQIRLLQPPIKHYNLIKELVESENLRYRQENISLRLVLGDARQTVKELKPCFDAVFLDPFAPKKQPELWQHEFFCNIKRLMKRKSLLATYSCARMVRDNLKKAGFTVHDGPRVGRPSPSTVAVNP